MKSLILAMLLLPNLLLANGVAISASSGSPIPVAFSASNSQSRTLACTGNVVEVLNDTTSTIGLGFGTASSTPTNGDFNFVPSGPASGNRFFPQGGLSSGTYLYVRSATGSTITSGKVYVSCYYEAK